ncbi:MAG: GNAT family N-acetyltransferase [Theionarchaea archaeon]|nr:MAG: hypothetical protein AYK19_08800 [Theionarchaea archaeon DG-70-1]MBU7025973.1 GNAT family N-acetyltransferase [Theionarchaea archaeon]
MDFTVRKAIPCDAETVARLYLQFWEVHKDIDPLIELKESPTRANQIEEAKKAIRKRTTYILVAVEKETNEVVGFIEFLIKKNEDCFKIKEYGYLDACVTDKKHRRKGVARELTKAAITFFKEKGITYVRTNIYNGNEPAQKVLQTLGFNPQSTIMMKMV